jgi:hypothetical protein
MRYLRFCLDPRVLATLGMAGVVVAVVAPGLVGAVVPLLVVTACPLSMAVMLFSMRPGARGAETAASSRASSVGDLRRELADLETRRDHLEAELAGFARPDPGPAAPPTRQP